MVKRVLDIAVSVFCLVFLSPVFVAVAVLVRSRLGRPILFRHERPGLHGTPFTLIKFRTMHEARSVGGSPVPDEHRMSAFGARLRSTSLDELPEFWNVLKGEMSVVGPRPLLSEYLSLYSERQHQRHDARPGITGWAQVNGRNALSWHDRLEMDVWYVENQSFWLDAKIIGMTLIAILRREGITQEGQVTVERFIGNKP